MDADGDHYHVYPNQLVSTAVIVKDIFNNSVIGYSGLFVKMFVSSPVGKTFEQSALDGLTWFDHYEVFGLIGTNMTITFTSSHIENYKLVVDVELVECPPGYSTSPDRTSCQQCTPGFYSLKPNSNKCFECPLGATCEADSVVSIEGYWVYYNEETGKAEVFRCPNNNCLANNTCSDFRDERTPLCGICKEGFTDWNNQCVGKFRITFVF